MGNLWPTSSFTMFYIKKTAEEMLQEAGILKKKETYTPEDPQSSEKEQPYHAAQNQQPFYPEEVRMEEPANEQLPPANMKALERAAKRHGEALKKQQCKLVKEKEERDQDQMRRLQRKKEKKEREAFESHIQDLMFNIDEDEILERYGPMREEAKSLFRELLEDTSKTPFDQAHKLNVHQEALEQHRQPANEQERDQLKESLEYQLLPSTMGKQINNDDELFEAARRRQRATKIPSWQQRINRGREKRANNR